MGLKKGINIFVVDPEIKREDMPKDVKEMFDLVDAVVSNTARICIEKNINISLLPSIYLHAFNKIAPLITESIVKDVGTEEAQTFLNGLKMIIDESFEVEKK